MIKPCPPLLVTSAIRASASKTALIDEGDRLRETLNGIRQWIHTPGVEQIVICDGSGFDVAPFLDELRGGSAVELESVTFSNSVEMVRARGKGWGEGEIVNYALGSSRILGGSPVFAKCTGKLWVANYLDCLEGFNGRASFDFNGLFAPTFIDTRFYIVERDFYAKHLMEAYKEVRDHEGFYLEHAFLDALRVFSPSQYLMCPTPRVRGVSGSMGRAYESIVVKAYLRDIRSRLLQVIGS